MAVAMLVILLAANVLVASAGKFASLPKTGCSKSACANPTMGFYKGTFTSASKGAIQNMNYGAYVRKLKCISVFTETRQFPRSLGVHVVMTFPPVSRPA